LLRGGVANQLRMRPAKVRNPRVCLLKDSFFLRTSLVSGTRPWARQMPACRGFGRPADHSFPGLQSANRNQHLACPRVGVRCTSLFAFLVVSQWASRLDFACFRSRLLTTHPGTASPYNGKYILLAGRSNSAGLAMQIRDPLRVLRHPTGDVFPLSPDLILNPHHIFGAKRLHFFSERPRSDALACFWHVSCPRSGISRRHARSPAGTGVIWTALFDFLDSRSKCDKLVE